MSEQFIDTNADEFIDAPKALRDAYDRLKARYTEVSSERDTYKGAATKAVLGDALKDFSNPALVQKALKADEVNVLDTEAVNAWLAENGSGFARGTGSAPAPTPADAEAAAQQRINGADLSAPADMSKIEAAKAALGDNPTPEQVAAYWSQPGV